MISNTYGVGMARAWFPRIVAEAFLESTKDGEIKLSPDPVTMIDGDLNWFNQSNVAQAVWVSVHRAPRSIVAQSPATVIIHDAWSWRVGVNPNADFPSVVADTFGGRMQFDRGSVSPDNLQYARYFLDGDDSHAWVDCGVVPAGQELHFRYLAAVQTPGVWTKPANFDPRWEANAEWCRLQALAWPVMS
jgi:hypothetical protein